MATVELLEQQHPVRTLGQVKDIIVNNDLGSFLGIHLSLLDLVAQPGGQTLLMGACQSGSLECLDYILDTGVNVNYQDRNGQSAIMLAILSNHPRQLEVIRRLLSRGNVDLNLKDREEKTVLDLVLERGMSYDLMEILIEFGAKIGNQEVPLIYQILSKYHHNPSSRVLGGPRTRLPGPEPIGWIRGVLRRINVIPEPEPLYASLDGDPNLEPEERIEEKKENLENPGKSENPEKSEKSSDLECIVSLLYQREGKKWDLGYQHPHERQSILILLIKRNLGQIIKRLLEDRLEEIQERHYLDDPVVGLYFRTPLMYALRHQRHEIALDLIKSGTNLKQNVRQFKDAYELKASSQSESIFEYAIRHLASQEVLRALLENGAILTRRNWLLWYFQCLRNKPDGFLITQKIYRRYQEMANAMFDLSKTVVRNTTIINESDCTCNLQAIAADYGFLEIFEYFRKDQNGDNLDLVHYAEICQVHGSMMAQVFRGHPGKDNSTILKMAQDLVDSGVIINPEYLTQVSDPGLAKLILDQDAIYFFERSDLKHLKGLTRYHPSIWQSICTHSKYKESLLRNEDEMVLFEEPEELERDYFIRMENGIFWDLRNLSDYIVKIVQGNNRYDEKSAYPGEQIWTDQDLAMLRYHSERTGIDLGRKICDFVDVNGLLEGIPMEILEVIGYCAKILSCRGRGFTAEIQGKMSNYQKEVWAQLQQEQSLSKDRMPRDLPIEIGKLVNQCKQKALYLFMQKYRPLSEDVKTKIVKLNSRMTEEFLDGLFRGDECLVEGGGMFQKTWERSKSWVNERGGSAERFLAQVKDHYDQAEHEAEAEPLEAMFNSSDEVLFSGNEPETWPMDDLDVSFSRRDRSSPSWDTDVSFSRMDRSSSQEESFFPYFRRARSSYPSWDDVSDQETEIRDITTYHLDNSNQEEGILDDISIRETDLILDGEETVIRDADERTTDIELILSQTDATFGDAERAYQENRGDIVGAIMSLTM